MIVYLSCDVQNDFFIKIILDSINEINKATDNVFELVYPPKKIGKDTGTVRDNILQIKQADIVVFDITPKIEKEIESYNSGVMIEFGIVLDLEDSAIPWGRIPKPIFRIFCNSKFPRGKITPIINETSISSYKDDADGEKALKTEVLKLLKDKLKENSNFKITPNIDQTKGQINRYSV